MADNKAIWVMALFAGASNAKEYKAAKLVVAKFEPHAQLAMVDTIRAARKRLIDGGLMTASEVRS